MSRKHFQRIAEALASIQILCENNGEQLTPFQTRMMVQRIGEVCGEFNSNFDRFRFMEATVAHKDKLNA